jgi:hypothetical protein
MSRSRKEEALVKLNARLDELDAAMVARAQAHPGEAMKIGMFQAAIKKIKRQAKDPSAEPSQLWEHAREHVESFVSKQKSEDSDLGHMTDLFAEPIEPPSAAAAAAGKPVSPVSIYDLPSPDALDYSDDELNVDEAKHYGAGDRRATHAMMFSQQDGHVGKEELVSKPIAKEVLILLNDNSGDIELSEEVVRNAQGESPEIIFLMVNHMIENYKKIIATYIPAADNADRKNAAIELSKNLDQIEGVLKSQVTPAEKTGAVKMMQAHFDTAIKKSSTGGKDVTKTTWWGENVNKSKIKVSSIYGRWDKEKGPLQSMVDTLEDKLRVGTPKPSTPVSKGASQ